MEKRFVLIMPMMLSIIGTPLTVSSDWVDYVWDWVLNKNQKENSFIYNCFNSNEGILNCNIPNGK
jgi:hypothetical protein